jgi:quinol monooxygenase YgiN
MVRTIVELKAKSGEIESVTASLAEFVDAVRRHEPMTELQAFRRGTEPVFVQVLGFPDAETERRHRSASYTRRFLEQTLPRCEADPVATKVTRIG